MIKKIGMAAFLICTQMYVKTACAAPDVDTMGQRFYNKGLQIGKWFAIVAVMFVAFKYFLNRKESASEHLGSIAKGVFLLVLAPTIIGLLFWIAGGLKV